MASRFTQISSVLRIVRGERDALVRTTHFKATVENVSNVTIERKIMSTKTTFKRVALVAVAAMGLGLLSVVPSSATSQMDTLTISSATGTMTVGGTAATTTVTQSFLGVQSDTMTVTMSLVSAPATNSVVPTLTNIAPSSVNGLGVVNGLVGTIWDTGSASVYTTTTASYTVTMDAASIAGTYVMKFTPANSTTVAAVAPAVTWTVVVSAANTAVTAADSTSWINAGVAVPTVDVAISAPKAAVVPSASNPAANIFVTPNNSVPALQNATLSVSISGPGTLGIGTSMADALNTQGRNITGAAGDRYITVYADGNAGESVITISAGTTVLATETVHFYGAATTLTATVIDSVIAPSVAKTAVLVVAKDALGYVVPQAAITVTSSNTAVIASGTSLSATAAEAADGTAGTVTVTPLALSHGSVTLTFSDSATTPVMTSTTATIIVSSASVATSVPSIAFDKASYLPGEKMTLTLSAVDANGLPVPNTVTAASLVGTLTANAALQGFTTPTAALTDGKITATMYAPLLSGDVVITGTGLNTAETALTATTTVAGGDAAAALEAANDAYDAANYAADAADAATTAAEEATAAAVAAGDAATAAQESADAALAAVTDLGLKVTGLISALRAQITSLTNLIVKIQKKVKA
ncbi:unannotated protein [freshwater metagenome]|uniref:Unannotated protein n=1 Tax=freshwater metagenome TaxID=449393 RepID=A0A6J7MI94_9ZZZZ